MHVWALRLSCETPAAPRVCNTHASTTKSVCSTSANFDFGQFRLRPISTSANFDFGQFRLRPISTSANFDFGQFRLFHTTTRELQTRTYERPGVSNTTKIPREDPQRGKVPQGRLKERVARLSGGEWVPLFEMSLECSMQGRRRKQTTQETDDLQCRVGRTFGFAQMGELSHARKALEGEPVAPSNENTWKALTNEAKRPHTDQELLDMNPTIPVD